MKKKYLIALFLLISHMALGDSLYDLCIKKTHPSDWDTFVMETAVVSFEASRPLTRENCTLIQSIADKTVKMTIMLPYPTDYLKFFPNLKTLSIYSFKPIKQIGFSLPAQLTRVRVIGNFQLENLDDLIPLKKLEYVDFNSNLNPSSVDLKDLEKLKHVKQIELFYVSVINAKGIENAKSLEYVAIDKAKLDGAVDWSLLPKLLMRPTVE